PTVNAGPALNSCANSPIVAITGATTSGANIAWTSVGGGSFSNAAIINPNFSPSAAQISAGTAQLTVTVTQPGCLPVSSNTTLTIAPTPIVSAGSPQTVCANNPAVTLNGSVTNATGLTWATLGDGNFN